MPYTRTTWENETPATSPVKYAVTDDTLGVVAASATIAPVTSITPGTPLDATRLNNIETGLVSATAFAEAAVSLDAAEVYHSSFTVAHNTLTLVNFASANYNPTGMWVVGTPSRLTVASAGIYVLNAYVVFSGNATGTRTIAPTCSNAEFRYFVGTPPGASSFKLFGTTVYLAPAGGYLTLYLLQTSGVSLTAACTLTAARVG